MNYKPLRQSVGYLLVATVFSITVLGQQPNQPSVERLRTHITYLASDALEGRRTGTPGANDAAHYIAGEFSQIGLRPAFQTIRSPRNRAEARSNYRQKFPYVGDVTLGNGNVITISPASGSDLVSLRVGEDWTPLGFSPNRRVENAEVVFAGYGITSSELRQDDYAGANAKDRVAVVFAGNPDGNNPHGQFPRGVEVNFKVAAAKAAGAQALVLISREENLKDDALFRLAYDNTGEAGIPVLLVSRDTAAKILGVAAAKLTEYEKSANTGGSPASKVNQTTSTGPENPVTPSVVLMLPSKGNRITILTDVIRREVAAANVIGILDGSDPTLKNEAIVIGAHYDHLGRGGAGSLAQREGDVHHGADDNASGVAGVLELARTFASQRPRPRRTLVFIAFSGEEEGLLGSNYYVNHPVVPLANTVAMINLDMIGRLKNRALVIGGAGTAGEWRPMIESANLLKSQPLGVAGQSQPASGSNMAGSNGGSTTSESSKTFQLTLNEDGFGPSDHSSFYAKQIPVLFFWTGTHPDYHKPSDTADKINYEDEARILAMVTRIVNDIDGRKARPTYTVARSAPAGRSTGFRVYLGTIPNYADSTDGLLLDGVREDSPASAAGLRAGDRIVKLAGKDVKNVYDYTYALSEMKAGQEYEVEVLRGSERLKLKLTPAERRQ